VAICYRVATEADRSLIIDSWLDSFKYSHGAGLIHVDEWQDVMVRQIARVLDRPGVFVWVAADPKFAESKADILGWIAVERDFDVPVRVWRDGKRLAALEQSPAPLVHYVYVRQPYRRSGVARRLFHVAGVDPSKRFLYTCQTATATKIRAAGKVPDSHWSPLIARHPKKNKP
jgi:GNAT superfamily N-acetyltransferase